VNPKGIKTVVFWVVIAVAALLLFQVIKAAPVEQGSQEISYSQFISTVGSGDVAKVTIAGSRIHGQYRNGSSFWLFGPTNQSLFLDLLHEKGVEIWFKDSGGEGGVPQLIGTWAPLLLLGGLWFFMIRQMRRRTAGLPVGGPSGFDNSPH
jgi:cell division protease FtsH